MFCFLSLIDQGVNHFIWPCVATHQCLWQRVLNIFECFFHIFVMRKAGLSRIGKAWKGWTKWFHSDSNFAVLILICCTQGHMFLCYLLVLWYCLRIIYVVLICSFWSTIFLLTCPDWYSTLNDLLALVCVFFPFTSY